MAMAATALAVTAVAAAAAMEREVAMAVLAAVRRVAARSLDLLPVAPRTAAARLPAMARAAATAAAAAAVTAAAVVVVARPEFPATRAHSALVLAEPLMAAIRRPIPAAMEPVARQRPLPVTAVEPVAQVAQARVPAVPVVLAR